MSNDILSLEGKLAVVTGRTSGIGLALALLGMVGHAVGGRRHYF